MGLFEREPPVHTKFFARLWLDTECLVESEIWVHEIVPTEGRKRPSADWIAEHFRESYTGRDNYTKWFDLDENKCYQVLLEGTINGYWCGPLGEEEWDEDLTLGDFTRQELPQSYFDKVYGP